MGLILKRIKIILVIFSIVLPAFSQQNILQPQSNNPIRFDLVSVKAIQDASSTVIRQSDSLVNIICSVPGSSRSFQNTFKVFDELLINIGDIYGTIRHISYAFWEDSIRTAAGKEADKIGTYEDNLYINERLYNSLKEFERLGTKANLPLNQQKFLEETIFAFEKNGIRLNTADKQKLAGINERIEYFSSLFQKNIINFHSPEDSIEFTKQELIGLDSAGSSGMAELKMPNGRYMARSSRGIGRIILHAEPESTRKQVIDHFSYFPGYPENLRVLDSLLFYRNKMATLLGYSGYAAFALEDRMAKTPQNARDFLYDLIPKSTIKARQELQLLADYKHKLHPELTDTIYYWDLDYYLNKVAQSLYAYSSKEIADYLEINQSIRGMFSLYEKLFGLSIVERKGVPVWNREVRYFDLYSDGKKAGSFYLDLFHRANKITAGGAFFGQLSCYNRSGTMERLPVGFIEADINEGKDTMTTLLTYAEFKSIFHEFGHLLNALLSRSDLGTQTGLTTKLDFIEAPSQFLENWCTHYESFKAITKHYQTGKPMPEIMFDNMLKSQNLLQACETLWSVQYDLLDLIFYDKYDSIKNMDLIQVAESLRISIKPEKDHSNRFIAAYQYFAGYGANQYGYLWSRVFSYDMFSVFEKNGIMDTSTGLKYKKTILEKGSSEDEMDMMIKFLGRKPNSNAYLNYLGIR